MCSQTAIYAQGVGLGASKAKEFGKYAEGYSGYVHMAQDAVSAIGLQGTEMTTSYRKFLPFCRNAGSGALWELGATRMIHIAIVSLLTFGLSPYFGMLHPTSFEELYLLFYKTCEFKFGIIQFSRHKARKPMIGARNRATALRVALRPEFVFCAIAPVGWTAPFHPGSVSETTALVGGRAAVAGPR